MTEVIHGEEGNAFKGVIPCWTQWGDLIGFGNDSEELEELFKIRNEEAKALAQNRLGLMRTERLRAWAKRESLLQGYDKDTKEVHYDSTYTYCK